MGVTRSIGGARLPKDLKHIGEVNGFRQAKHTATPYARRAVVQHWATARRVYRPSSSRELVGTDFPAETLQPFGSLAPPSQNTPIRYRLRLANCLLWLTTWR